jgi:TldD protein
MTDARRLADHFFFARNNTDPDAVVRIVTRALHKADGGEFFAQRLASKTFQFADGRLKVSHYGLNQGYGLRFISGDRVSYAHGQDFSEKSIAADARSLGVIARYGIGAGRMQPVPAGTGVSLYTAENPLDSLDDAKCVALIEAMDRQARAADPRVVEVSASIATEWEMITIIRHDGRRMDDLRPMSSLMIAVYIEQDGRREVGSAMNVGRCGLDDLILRQSPADMVRNALADAEIQMQARPGPGGEMPVVIGNGWGGVLLHESVGHGLEGDAVYQGASVYAGRLGERVASPGVTIIDRGNMEGGHRGSLHFDDEGHPTQENILIEDGILKSYMQDSISARKLNMAPTGNARREDYQSVPLPRMTATFMAAGKYSPDEIIESVDRGIYVVDFTGGQVDPAKGKFTFSATKAFMIENGKVTYPVKGAMLIGNGPRAMQQVDMVGTDLAFSVGGNCGKDGQSVPVQVGQPTVKMRGLKVGSNLG